MHINRDELLLLTLRERLPLSSGAGPPRPRRAPLSGWHRRGARTGAGDAGPRRAASRLPRVAAVSRRGPEPAGGYAERATYLEMEFAVGFGADDEPWL